MTSSSPLLRIALLVARDQLHNSKFETYSRAGVFFRCSPTNHLALAQHADNSDGPTNTDDDCDYCDADEMKCYLF